MNVLLLSWTLAVVMSLVQLLSGTCYTGILHKE